MKNIVSLIAGLCFCVLICQAQQITLEGKVSMHNSGYNTGTIKFVPDVYISADFATPTQTDQNGAFLLVFQSRSKGDIVEVDVEKDQLEVVNETGLLDVVLGRITPVRIYLAQKGELAQAQTELYEISLETITAKFEATIRKLEKEGAESEAAIQSLERQLNTEIKDRFEAQEILTKKLAEAKKGLPEAIKKITRVNLDFATQEYQQAFEYYKAGEIEQALESLSITTLEKQTNKALAGLANIDSTKKEYQLVVEQELEIINQIVQSYTLKSEAYSLLFDYQSALEVYQKAVQLLEDTKLQEDLQLANVYNELSLIYKTLGRYDEGLEYAQKNLDIKQSFKIPDSPDLATAFNNLALLYLNAGQLQEADSAAVRAIEVMENIQFTDPRFYSNLAVIQRNLGYYDEAVSSLLQAIRLMEEMPEVFYRDIAVAYNNLSIVYRNMDLLEEAVETQRKAVDVFEQNLDPGDPWLAAAYANLASACLGIDSIEEAMNLQQKAIEIAKEVFGPVHPNMGRYYQGLSAIHGRKEEYVEALRIELSALEIFEQSLGATHLDVAFSYANLSIGYERLGDYDKAMEYQNESIKILEQNLDLNHPRLAPAYSQKSLIYSKTGRNDEALDMELKSLDILEMALDSNHASIADCYSVLGTRYLAVMMPDKAISSYERALEIYVQKKKYNHQSIAGTYINLAGAHSLQGKYTEALAIFKEGINLYGEELETNHLKFAGLYSNLSFIYVKLEEYEEALSAENKALEIRLQAFGNEHADCASSYGNLVDIYLALGEFEEAWEVQKNEIKIREGLGDPLLMTIYFDFSDKCQEKGGSLVALTARQAGIEYLELYLGPDSDISEQYTSLATSYRELGEHDRAIYALEKALSIKKQILDSNDPSLGYSYLSIGLVLVDIGKHEEARQHVVNAETILENTLGTGHSYTQATKKLLEDINKNILYGDFSEDSGNYLELMAKFSKEAIELVEEGKYYEAANSLARVSKYGILSGNKELGVGFFQKAVDLGFDDIEWLQAEPAFSQVNTQPAFVAALEFIETKSNNVPQQQQLNSIKEKIVAAKDSVSLDNPFIIDLYDELTAYYNQYGYDIALGYYNEAITFFTMELESRKINSTYENLGSAYLLHFLSSFHMRLAKYNVMLYGSSKELILQFYNPALSAQLEAVRIQELISETGDEKLAISYYNLSSIYFELEYYEKALDIQLKSLETKRKVEPINKQSISNSYNSLARIYWKMENYTLAIETFLLDISLLKEFYGDIHPYIADGYSTIATIYMEMENYTEALSAQYMSLEVLKNINGIESFRVMESQMKLVKIENLLKESRN